MLNSVLGHLKLTFYWTSLHRFSKHLFIFLKPPTWYSVLSLILLSTFTLPPNLFTISGPFNMTPVLHPIFFYSHPTLFSFLIVFSFPRFYLCLWSPFFHPPGPYPKTSFSTPPHCSSFLLAYLRACASHLVLKKPFSFTLIPSELPSYPSFSVLLISINFTTVCNLESGLNFQ